MRGISCSWNGEGSFDIPVRGVHADSRKIKKGDVFVAIRGVQTDGHLFIKDVLKKSPAAIFSENCEDYIRQKRIPHFRVLDSRRAFAVVIANIYGTPTDKLSLVGITGTNGKTTTSFLIQYMLNRVSKAGLIGTVHYDDGKKKRSADNTTPGAELLNEQLNEMVKNGLSYCVMEVSSHALDQRRVEGLRFRDAIFTNLTQDHFDYHKDFENYYQAKKKLFTNLPLPERAIINTEDQYGVRLAQELKKTKVITYGFSPDCDYYADQISENLSEIEFILCRRKNRLRVKVPLQLRYNVLNVLAALAYVDNQGFALETMVEFLTKFPGVSGRMERIDVGQAFHVFVDYAHTPDAIENVLLAVKRLPCNRIISVVGCGGNRDRDKRPKMGAAAERYSDILILTSDNPRGEDPLKILEDVKKGIGVGERKIQVLILPDRTEAIQRAVEIADEGDMILIFGKGHENYQIIGKEKIPFSDQNVVRYALKERLRGKRHSKGLDKK